MQQQVAGYPLNLSEGNFVNPEANALLMAQTQRGKKLFKKRQLPLPPAPQHPHAAVAPGPLGQLPPQAAPVANPVAAPLALGQPPMQPQVQAASPTELTNKLVADKYGKSGGRPLTVGEVEALDLKAHQMWNASQRQGLAQTVTLPTPPPQPVAVPMPVPQVPVAMAPPVAPTVFAAPVQQQLPFAAAQPAWGGAAAWGAPVVSGQTVVGAPFGATQGFY